MIDVTASGTEVSLLALQTFPIGFVLRSFADDVDPILVEEIEPTGFEMLYDGSLFSFDKAAPIIVSFGVIPGSSDDANLKIMLQARKSNASILPFPDSTSAVFSYPDGGKVILSNGTILSGPLLDGMQSSGRKKGNVYKFAFGSFAGAQSRKQFVASVVQGIAGFG